MLLYQKAKNDCNKIKFKIFLAPKHLHIKALQLIELLMPESHAVDTGQ